MLCYILSWWYACEFKVDRCYVNVYWVDFMNVRFKVDRCYVWYQFDGMNIRFQVDRCYDFMSWVDSINVMLKI